MRPVLWVWKPLTDGSDMCIERDSRKDQAVVFIFIFATGGLLLWALVKPWVERYIEVRQSPAN